MRSTQFVRRASLAVALACFASQCAAQREPAHNAAAASDDFTLRYTVRLTSDLMRAEVVVCNRDPAAFSLRPGRDEAGSRLLYARLISPTPTRKLASHDGIIDVPPGSEERCVGYGVELRDGGHLASLVSHTEGGLVSSVNAWLWRPQLRSPNIRARLAFSLPEGAAAYAPYPRNADGSFALDARAFRFDAYVVFGAAQHTQFSHRGVRIDTVTLAHAIDARDLDAWLSHHLDALAPLEAALAQKELVVLALPSPADSAPFGCVTRGGTPSVLVFVPRGSTRAALEADWVLSHELSHFALPFVKREDAWASEGFATYFQEVLRSRARQRSARAVAEDMYRTLQEVEREMGPGSLAEESRAMEHSHRYRGVYWGGAAVFLAMDVALRVASAGHVGLAELVARLDPAQDTRGFWSADELLEALDQRFGKALVRPLALAAIARPFPDFRASFAQLGITESHGELVFDDAARTLRAQIFGAE